MTANRSRPLWTVAEVCAATGGRTALDGETAVTAVSIDSRKLAAGALFIALPGERFDGHDFLAAALASGAAAALVSRPHDALPDGLTAEQRARLIHCADSFAALDALAQAARDRCPGQRVAVTGSVGKTGTKEMLACALSAYGRTHATQGNLNNHLGVPLTLANAPADSDFLVLEMGMSAPGEIRHLTGMGRPQAAIVTAIALAHSAFFDSEAGIAAAKAEIYEGLTTGPAGAAPLALFPADSPHAAFLRAQAAAVTGSVFGFGAPDFAASDARITALHIAADGRQVIEAEVAGQPLGWSLQLLGSHWARNSLAVALLLVRLGLDPQPGLAALDRLAPIKGRGNLIALARGIRLVDETYNASPAAMQAALRAVGGLPHAGRRVAILGDMLELGRDGPEAHIALAATLQQQGFDLLLGCGPLTAQLCAAVVQQGALSARSFDSSAALLPQLGDLITPGDLVLVKGSLGSKMALIVERLCAGG